MALSMRWFCMSAGVVVSLILTQGAAGGDLELVYRGKASIEMSATDQNGQAFDVSGLSGITWAGGNTYWAVMDNSDKLVKLSVDVNADGSIASAVVAGGLTVSASRDYEGIAFTNAQRNSVWLSDEASSEMGVREFSLDDGSLMSAAPMPTVYADVRGNFGLESVTMTPDRQTMWTANEEALSVDGSLSSTTAGSVVRLQRFDMVNNVPAAGTQYAYVTDPVHTATNDDPTQPGSVSRSGLSDLVALPDGRLLALERSFARAGNYDLGSQYRNSIFLLDLEAASDVSSMSALESGEFTPVGKTDLWSITQGILDGAQIIGNLEGLALGPRLENNNYLLLGIVDSGGSSDPLSDNRLVAFELVGVPEPATAVLLLAGMMTLMRRRP